MNTMNQIKVRYGKGEKLVPIQQFLKEKNLSGITRKIQDALNDLYKLNAENNPSLFHFPNFPEDKPLIIDCITPTDDDCSAHYKTGEHVIEFVRNLHDNPLHYNSSFSELLAHELTHAEQDVSEINDLAKENGYRYHQIQLLMESQAFAKEKKVRRMLKGENCSVSENEKIHAVKLEIERLRINPYYRNRWAEYFPIKKEDTPLTTIPDAFHLPHNLLALIREFPRDVLKPELRRMDEIRACPKVVYTYFSCEANAQKRAVSADKLLDKILFDKNVSSNTLQQDLEMIDFLLNQNDENGKSIFPENNLIHRFFFKEAMEGVEESKILKESELLTDSTGKKILPEGFAEKAKKMTISEFSNYLHHYFEVMNPVLDLDDDLITDSQVEISDKKKLEKKNKREQVTSYPSKKDPTRRKERTVVAEKLIRKFHQTSR